MIPGESFQLLVRSVFNLMAKPILTKSGFRLRAVALAASCGVLLVGCGGGSATTRMDDDEPTLEQQAAQRQRVMEQTTALDNAHTALTAAVDAIVVNPTQPELDEANAALKALRDAIAAAVDVADKTKYDNAATTQKARIDDAQARFNDDESDRMQSEVETKRMNDAAAAAKVAAMATKLHAGISAPTAADATPEATIRFAAYNDDGDAIHVQNGVAASDAKALSEDKDATVAAHHGWTGKRYHRTTPADEGTYEAHVYSHVGEPTMGPKFNSGAGEGNVGFDLDETSGETPTFDSTFTGYAARVASNSFDQSAGTKEFEKDVNAVRLTLSGTYYGVEGTYYCRTVADSTCAARKVAKGFELGHTLDSSNAFTQGGWTFKPTDPNTRVTSTPDASYASYGWWLHKSQDDRTYTASAFTAYKGTPGTISLTDLMGTATYSGGAVGKYALSSSTGGTNDAGHFTAEATLEANFSDNSITGTIHNFMGADGMSRDWSVELKEAVIGAAGLINTSGLDDGTGLETVWTIDGTAAAATPNGWHGRFYEVGDSGVPAIATGTFYTQHGNSGKMVGAFGVNEEE